MNTMPQVFSAGLVLSIDKLKLPHIVGNLPSREHHALNGTGVRNDVVEGVSGLVTRKSQQWSMKLMSWKDMGILSQYTAPKSSSYTP